MFMDDEQWTKQQSPQLELSCAHPPPTEGMNSSPPASQSAAAAAATAGLCHAITMTTDKWKSWKPFLAKLLFVRSLLLRYTNTTHTLCRPTVSSSSFILFGGETVPLLSFSPPTNLLFARHSDTVWCLHANPWEQSHKHKVDNLPPQYPSNTIWPGFSMSSWLLVYLTVAEYE